MLYRSNIFILVSRVQLDIEQILDKACIKYYFCNGRYFAYIIDFDCFYSRNNVVDMLSNDDVKSVIELIPVRSLYDALEYLEDFFG